MAVAEPPCASGFAGHQWIPPFSLNQLSVAEIRLKCTCAKIPAHRPVYPLIKWHFLLMECKTPQQYPALINEFPLIQFNN